MSTGPRIRGDEATLVADPRSATAAAMPSSALTPSSGTRQMVGNRYEILRLLGSGGMGTVYRARDTELDEMVALKMLRRDLVDAQEMLERFRREVKLARRVTHRNVARTFDIGEHGGDKFLTMEFIDGESLGARLCRSGRMPLREVIDVACAVCAGLAAAHAAGVIHRDLKPDNILIGHDGRVAITDFGVARALAVMGDQPRTLGAPAGTPAYMAPEQVEGCKDVDARADVYALGTILYEMVTGERAWCGDSVYSVAVARLTQPPPDPRKIIPDLPDAVRELVLKCLARKPEQRFGSAEDVARALANLTTGGFTAHSPVAAPSLRAEAHTEGKAIAVLPFRNASAPEDEYLADGITDDLIDGLSMIRGLKVRSRSAVMRYKGAERDAREIGRELGVDVVVEGSVRKRDGALRVSARLVGVADGFQLWAKRFECGEKDFLSVGDDAADAIAEALAVAREVAPRRPPTDPEAIDLYLRARHLYHQGWALKADMAIELFEQALARAPDDPIILSGYALAMLRRFGMSPDAVEADRAGEAGCKAAERALALAPQLGEARTALASHCMLLCDYVGVARHVREALRVAPASADAHDLYGRLLVEVGLVPEGIASLKAASMLEPHLYRARADIARARALLGDFSGVEELVASPPSEAGDQNIYWFYQARMCMWRKDGAAAEDALRRLAATNFAGRIDVSTIFTLVSTGSAADEVVRALERWGTIVSRAHRRPLFFRQLVAEVNVLRGDVAGMYEALESAVPLGLLDIAWLDRCPLFGEYRADTRFVALRKPVAARAEEVIVALKG